MSSNGLTISRARPDDIPFVIQSWLRAYRRSPWAGVIPNNLYDQTYGETINQLFNRGLRVKVLQNAANPGLIVAWIAYEVLPRGEIVVHFLFTKPLYRKKGLAKALLADIGANDGSFLYTFKTPAARYFRSARFKPEIGRRKDNDAQPQSAEAH